MPFNRAGHFGTLKLVCPRFPELVEQHKNRPVLAANAARQMQRHQTFDAVSEDGDRAAGKRRKC